MSTTYYVREAQTFHSISARRMCCPKYKHTGRKQKLEENYTAYIQCSSHQRSWLVKVSSPPPLFILVQTDIIMSSESPKPGLSKKKQGNKKGGNAAKSTIEKGAASLERDPTVGMKPRAILTGLYGSRGERIRHTVHDGSLLMPREALDLIAEVTKETGVTVPTSFNLPGLDTVLRPCVDPQMETVIITNLCLEKASVIEPSSLSSPDDTDLEGSSVEIVRTKVENRTIVRPIKADCMTSRIRGGGGDDTQTGSTGESQSHSMAAAVGASGDSIQSTPTIQPSTNSESTNTVNPLTTSSIVNITASSIATQPTPGWPATNQASTVPVEMGTPSSVPSSQVSSQSNANAGVATITGNTEGRSSGAASTSTANPVLVTSASSSTAVAAAVTTTTTPQPPSLPPKDDMRIKIERLPSRPIPQWVQHKPGPNDETVTPADQLTPKPFWYSRSEISDVERKMLPEWFNSSAPHRTPQSYMTAREKMIEMSDQVANRNLTNSMIRRTIPGDAGSLHRLRSFLVDWGLINEDGINDSAPTPAVLRAAW